MLVSAAHDHRGSSRVQITERKQACEDRSDLGDGSGPDHARDLFASDGILTPASVHGSAGASALPWAYSCSRMVPDSATGLNLRPASHLAGARSGPPANTSNAVADLVPGRVVTQEHAPASRRRFQLPCTRWARFPQHAAQGVRPDPAAGSISACPFCQWAPAHSAVLA